MTLYRIRFTRPAQVERVHEDRRRGGYRVDPIAIGTEMTVNEASLRFWRARDCVEVLERIRSKFTSHPVKVAESVSIAEPPVNPFAFAAAESPKKPPTKASLRRAMEDAIQAIQMSDCMVLKEALSRVDRDVPGVNPDSLTLIDAAIEDLESGSLAVNASELVDAIKDVLQQTLPPSRRS